MRTVFILFILLAFCSCKNSKPNKTTDSVVVVDEVPSHQNLKSLFSNFEILPLATDSSSYFGDITKLVVHDENYYILDKMGRRQVLRFDKAGRYVNSFGQLGKGKGEYINILDFTIDEENNRLVILAYPSTVYVYNMDGSFAFSKKIEKKSLLWSLISYKNGFVCSTNHQTFTKGDDAFLFYFYDKEFNLRSKEAPVLPLQMVVPSFVCNIFSYNKEDNEILYFDGFTSTVYEMSMGEGSTFRKVQFQLNNAMSYENFSSLNKFYAEQGKYSFIMNGICMGREVLAFYSGNNGIHGFLTGIDKTEAYAFVFDGWFPRFLYYKDGGLYAKISAADIKENETLFESIPSEEVLRNQGNDFILKFKCKLKPE